MSRHVDFEELQDYQEGLLAPEREREIKVHLGECQDCRDDLAALQGLLAELGDLPVEVEPSRDLWPQIMWRIGGSEAGKARAPRRSAITLPVWQLAAASVAVALLSGGAVWAFISGTAQPSYAPGAPSASVAQAAGLGDGFAEYDTAIGELETILETGWEVLDPETVLILEENLAVIDRAIEESREALADDPGSGLLRRILTETMRRKVDFLQQAAAAIYANT